jgi:DNA polymerase-3 subunit alpha
MGIDVLPPSVLSSFGDFTVIQNKPENEKNGVIRFGLYTIKNLGKEIADYIIEERKENGPYNTLSDMLKRIQHKNFNKKSLEALIQCGALDELGERGILFANAERMLEFSKSLSKNIGQDSLFGGTDTVFNDELTLQDAPPLDSKVKLGWEKDLLGLYITDHPLNEHKELFDKAQCSIEVINESYGEGRPVIFGGFIEGYKPVLTKKNDRMAILQIVDFTGTIEAIIFPKAMKEIESKITLEGDISIAIKGKVTIKNDQKSIVVEAIKKL